MLLKLSHLLSWEVTLPSLVCSCASSQNVTTVFQCRTMSTSSPAFWVVLQIREGINVRIPIYQTQGITRHYHVAFWIMCFLKLASKYGLFKENLSIVSPKMFCKWNKKKKITPNLSHPVRIFQELWLIVSLMVVIQRLTCANNRSTGSPRGEQWSSNIIDWLSFHTCSAEPISMAPWYAFCTEEKRKESVWWRE